jgi:hypothetical protein
LELIMPLWEVLYVEGDRELAREPIGDVPGRDDEVFIEQHSGIVPGGRFKIVRIRRVLTETGTHESTQRAAEGGPIDVAPRRAYVYLKRLE